MMMQRSMPHSRKPKQLTLIFRACAFAALALATVGMFSSFRACADATPEPIGAPAPAVPVAPATAVLGFSASTFGTGVAQAALSPDGSMIAYQKKTAQGLAHLCQRYRRLEPEANFIGAGRRCRAVLAARRRAARVRLQPRRFLEHLSRPSRRHQPAGVDARDAGSAIPAVVAVAI